jgi:hypothetical protein
MSDTQPIVNEEPVIEAPEAVEEVTETAPQPGEKTDPALLLRELQEERREKRELKRKLDELKAAPEPDPDVFSEEGIALKNEIKSIHDKLALTELTAKYPQLKDKASEFEDFRADPENKGMSVATAAKAFLAERNLLNVTPAPRKGLETDTGGGRQPVKIGRTEEEVGELRTTNFRKYMQELKKGTLRG